MTLTNHNPRTFRPELEALHPQSFSWAVSCCAGDLEEAAEVLQGAYLKVLEGQASFHGRASLRTWFFGVIRNTAAERRRILLRWWRPFKLGLHSEEEGHSESDCDPERACVNARLAQVLAEAIQRLSARQQEVLTLVFGHDMTLEECAETIGVSLGTVRQHYERGKCRLRATLHELEQSHESRPKSRAASNLV